MSQAPGKTTQKTPPADDGLSEFFLVVTPGLESLAEKEINFWAPDIRISAERGGLTFRASLILGCELNRALKIPTRILLRLTAFGCKDFPKLFKKTANFNWDEWISGDVEVQASTHKSRLFIKKRIEETCRDGFVKFFETMNVNETSEPPAGEPQDAQQIFVRINDDVCTFSIDTSGELLHKRGTKVLSSDAPLRETIAAALLTWMSSDDPEAPGGVTLVDPMVGSGTFAIEASHLDAVLSKRSYAFERFPRYQKEKAEQPSAGLIRTRGERVRYSKFIGFDVDVKMAETTKRNWQDLGDPRSFEIKLEDIFTANPLTIEGERWLICNPPYGERLKIEGRLKDFYERLFESCERVVRPDRACFILPDTANPTQLTAPQTWRLRKSLRFQNGGLPVTALLFSRVR